MPRPVALLTAMAAVNVSLLLAGAGARGRSALARVRPVIGHRGFRVAAALALVLMAGRRGRSSSLPRPHRRTRPRALHPVRAPDDRRGLRRAGRGADRARARVPAHPRIRRDPARRARGHPGRGGQELLLPLRDRLRRVPARGLEDAGHVRLVLVAPLRGRASPRRLRDLPAGRLDAHPAARARLLPAPHDRPGGRWHADRQWPPGHGGVEGAGRARHQQARAQDRGDPSHLLARERDGAALRVQAARQAGDPRPLRELHLHGERPLRVLRRLRVLLRQAALELRAGGRGQGRPPRRHHQVAPRLRAVARERGARRDAAATTSWP